MTIAKRRTLVQIGDLINIHLEPVNLKVCTMTSSLNKTTTYSYQISGTRVSFTPFDCFLKIRAGLIGAGVL